MIELHHKADVFCQTLCTKYCWQSPSGRHFCLTIRTSCDWLFITKWCKLKLQCLSPLDILYCAVVTTNFVMTRAECNFAGFNTNTRTNTAKFVGDLRRVQFGSLCSADRMWPISTASFINCKLLFVVHKNSSNFVQISHFASELNNADVWAQATTLQGVVLHLHLGPSYHIIKRCSTLTLRPKLPHYKALFYTYI
jgi:hypothetical protein